MYGDFAYIYDKMMYDVDYIKWADYIEDLFRHYGIRPVDIADLACGTGNITAILAERGYSVMGIDSSEDMLAVAHEKAYGKGLRIPFICQDLRRISLHQRVDAALIICDGINYILEDSDLDEVFSGIYSILKPHGVLLFDISSRYKLSSILGNNIMVDDDPDISLIWQNDYDEEEGICTMDLTFFVRKGSLYRRFDETHIQKAHRACDIVGKLKQNNFVDIKCYGHMGFTEPDKDSQRLMFASRKPK
ncbi:MAG TPA: class I SAM-dependent methyltransferase [Clostridia bacterium]|nr:class I SAM-dependent methyltransferase [Clostridia bacterium]